MFFSFITPIYDRTDVLREAIESMLNQSYPNFEILLIMDDSPDETIGIVHEYAAQDKRIKTFKFSNKSGNACRGRNKAILMAKGDYVVFNDSDDISLQNRLAWNREIISETGSDVVSGCALYRVETDNDERLKGLPAKSQTIDLSLNLLARLNPFVTSCVSVRRLSLLEHGGFRPSMHYREDQELWLRLYYNGCKFTFKNDVISIYRLHEKNLEKELNGNSEYWLKCCRLEFKKKFNSTDWILPAMQIETQI